MTGLMKRLVLALALLATTTTQPGCMIALGSKFESGHKAEIEELDERLADVEEQLDRASEPAKRPADVE